MGLTFASKLFIGMINCTGEAYLCPKKRSEKRHWKSCSLLHAKEGSGRANSWGESVFTVVDKGKQDDIIGRIILEEL